MTTKGFRDLLHIGNQSRPAIFDLEIRVPDVLYSQVVEVDEQVRCLAYIAFHVIARLLMPSPWNYWKLSSAPYLRVQGSLGLQELHGTASIAWHETWAWIAWQGCIAWQCNCSMARKA